jgi:hypothetical protein
MPPPIVVQGTAVSNPHAPPATANAYAAASPAPTNFAGKGETQETRCRDPIFAVLLYANVIAIVAVAFTYGPDAVSSNSSNVEYEGYVIATVISALLSLVFAALGLLVLMAIPETLIKVSLIFVVIMAGVWAALAFLSGSVFAGIMGIIFFAISICYARAVWSRIPFATINLVTACTAIKANWGVVGYAYIFTALAGLWSVAWAVAFVGVYDQTYTCDDVTNQCTDVNYGYLFLLFVAYFFTHQVLQNSIHVTVAGMVGTWWFEPEDASCCCSPSVNNSFLRTITTSFGSICFGSLIVAVIRALQMLANAARANDDGNFLVCIAECILSCLASIVEYFNKWAFIYVGLYGYGYMEAGKNVFTLFRNRGWEAVIADDLINNTLFLISVIMGGIMGSIALIISLVSDLFEDAGGNEKGIAFALGFVIGLVMTSIAMSTIASAVNAIIVLFAEAPAEFQQNYPDLSNRMRQTWSQIYPGSV